MTEAVLTLVIVALVLGAAIYLVPLAAKRIVEREEEREDERRRGWLHEHERHERHDPKPRKREPETEEDL